VQRLIATLALLLALAASGAALDRAHYRELQSKAAGFYKQKDWPGLKQTLLEIGRELPAVTPRQMLTMASVEMHLGNKAEALKWMQRYAATGLTYDVASDDDLAPLARDPAFNTVANRLEGNSKPIEKAELVCSLPIADLMPEDLTFQSSSKTFYMSSVQHHSLYGVTPPKPGTKECVAVEVPLPADAKRWPTLAVSWDEQRKALWMSTSAMRGVSGFPQEDEGKAALLAVDPKSGKVIRRLELATDSPSVLGDMSIGKDGTVYITDSVSGGVYRIATGDLGQARLEKIAD